MAMQWPALVNKIKLNSLTCAQEALFSVLFQHFFFPFSYNFLTKWELLTDFRFFLSQIKRPTGAWMLRKWGGQLSPSLKDQIRFLTGSKIPLFTFTRNWVIPVANHCSDPQCMHTRIWILIGYLCFHFQGTLVQQYWDVLRSLEGKGIPYLWLEYCLGLPKQTISWPGAN